MPISHGQRPILPIQEATDAVLFKLSSDLSIGVVDVPGRGGADAVGGVQFRSREKPSFVGATLQFPVPANGQDTSFGAGRVCHSFSRRWRRPLARCLNQQLRPDVLRPNRQHQPSLHLRPKHWHQDHHTWHLRRESAGRAIRRVFHARVGRSVVAHPHRRPRQRGRCGHQPDGVFDQRLRRNLPQRMGRLSQQRESLHLRFWDNRHAGHRRRVPNGDEQRRLLVGGDESRRNGFAIRHVFWWRRVVRARGWGNLAI